MPERRTYNRTKVVLPVKICTGNSTQVLAYTIDISCKGARIAGLHEELEIGSTVKLLRGTHRATFKIVWVRQVGPAQIQAGIEAEEASETFWGVDLQAGDRKKAEEMDALLELLKGAKTRRTTASQTSR